MVYSTRQLVGVIFRHFIVRHLKNFLRRAGTVGSLWTTLKVLFLSTLAYYALAYLCFLTWNVAQGPTVKDGEYGPPFPFTYNLAHWKSDIDAQKEWVNREK